MKQIKNKVLLYAFVVSCLLCFYLLYELISIDFLNNLNPQARHSIADGARLVLMRDACENVNLSKKSACIVVMKCLIETATDDEMVIISIKDQDIKQNTLNFIFERAQSGCLSKKQKELSSFLLK